jgi:hypothetical protein
VRHEDKMAPESQNGNIIVLSGISLMSFTLYMYQLKVD